MRDRFNGDVAPQSLNAVVAACTARSTSFASAKATFRIVSPVAGLLTTPVREPDDPAR